MAKSNNSIRIISGTLRGRKIPVLDIQGLRPTGDRVREVLFNWLQFEIPGKHILDLFAGSGVLGLEAASRGAKSVTFIEKDTKAYRQLQDICRQLNLNNTHVHNTLAESYLKQSPEKFDLVFVDPPFGDDKLKHIIPMIENHLNEGGFIYCEMNKDQASEFFTANFELYRQKTMGQVKIEVWQKTSDCL